MKGERDLVGIERLLGLKSARGISRQKNLDSPPVKDVLECIKNFSKEYVHASNGDIRSSENLKNGARAVFDRYGPLIWPGPEEPRPSWLEEPSETHFDGKYPRHLYYTQPGDREVLWEHFYHLVVQKCCNYHDNQLQKYRRSSAKLRTEDSELTPGTPRNDDSPEGADSDIELIGSDRPSWLPINHSDARNTGTVPTSQKSSPIMDAHTAHTLNNLPGVYVTRTESADMAERRSVTPRVASPVAASDQYRVYENPIHYYTTTESDAMDVDDSVPANVNRTTADHHYESDTAPKRKRADTIDDDDDQHEGSDDRDDHVSKRARSETEEADGDDRSLVVKLKFNDSRALLATRKSASNLHLDANPNSPGRTRTRSSSIARSTQHGDAEGTKVRVKQYRDNKGKWYEVDIESRPHWALDERVITRTIPPERRRGTWTSRHAAFSPNTLSTSETRASIGAVTVSSRPSSIAGQEAYATGRRDSVRSEEQREREREREREKDAEEPDVSMPEAPKVPGFRESSNSEHVELCATKIEPGLEPEMNAQLLQGSQATAGSERPDSTQALTSLASPTATSAPGRSLVTAFDQRPPEERSPQDFATQPKAGVHVRSSEVPLPPQRNTSVPPVHSNGISAISHHRTGSGSRIPDRTIIPLERPIASPRSPYTNVPAVSSGSSHLKSPPHGPTTNPELPNVRETETNSNDEVQRAQDLTLTPGAPPASLQGAPWPPNPYAAHAKTGAPPIQVQGQPFSLSGSTHGHPSPSAAQDPRILNETARFRFVDQNPVFNGTQQQQQQQQQQRPSSQHSRSESTLKLAAPSSAHAGSSSRPPPVVAAQQPIHGLPQHLPPVQNVKAQPLTPSGHNAHIPPSLQIGPPQQHHRQHPNAPPAHPQAVAIASPVTQHRPISQMPPSQQSVKEDPDPQLVFDVLGGLADCPVGQYIQARCPDLVNDRDCLCVVKETLLRVPEARNDWTSLESALKQQCQKDPYFCATAIDKHKQASLKQTNLRKGSPGQPLSTELQDRAVHQDAMQRKPSLPLWASPLGVDPATAPKALPAIAVSPGHPSESREGYRNQSSAAALPPPSAPSVHKAKQPKHHVHDAGFRAYPPAPTPVVPSNGQAIRPPPPPSHSHSHSHSHQHQRQHQHQPQYPHPHPHPQRPEVAPSPIAPSPIVKSEDINEDLLNNTFIEINWGRQEVEYSDHMTMQDCKDCITADDFFGIIESRVPDEIRGKFRGIREIRVKALNELQGKERLPRFVRNNGSVRGGMRSLVKLLKAQPLGTEPELEFLTVWE